jgi:hypothetical protein
MEIVLSWRHVVRGWGDNFMGTVVDGWTNGRLGVTNSVSVCGLMRRRVCGIAVAWDVCCLEGVKGGCG